MEVSVNVTVLGVCLGSSRPFELSRYRQPQESFPPQQPPSPQAEGGSQAPKTHRVMTLADHISVRAAGQGPTQSNAGTQTL